MSMRRAVPRLSVGAGPRFLPGSRRPARRHGYAGTSQLCSLATLRRRIARTRQDRDETITDNTTLMRVSRSTSCCNLLLDASDDAR
ncbi:hypothetical protein MTF65_14810 [Streptomyces sp. APSN-46.1]|uniref:hypothetical protein n=1 Tax=Streptomyces sp. APSN-46.1 TaxID=2929049 RepID=UPI001FB54C3F|nr:hypothetical protein [Streptomyces sp. APSN-46.1]MCJ1678597.1 hypothetical protein [Streptomyces sp. APSN-46.1]